MKRQPSKNRKPRKLQLQKETLKELAGGTTLNLTEVTLAPIPIEMANTDRICTEGTLIIYP